MKKNHLFSVAAGSVALLVTTVTLAVPFNSFDPKTMAMGGAGVAVANPATASYFNPALLSIADTDDDFALELPVFGVRVYDPDDFVDAVDDFDETVVDDLDTAIASYNGSPGDSVATVAAINAVNEEVLTLNDKPFQFEGGVGVVLSIPGEKFGIAFTASGSANFSGIFNYEDAETVTDLTDDMLALDACYAAADPLVDPVAFESCVTAPGKFNFVDLSDPLNPEVTFVAASDTGEDSDILSTVNVLGVVMAEAGITISREMSIFGTEVAVGVTPKVVSVTVFDYEASAEDADTDDIDGDDFTADYSDFNLDIGIAMDHKNGWRSGFVIKNIISQDYDAKNTDPDTGVETKTGRSVSLKPQARIGVSHTNGWSTVAVDVDLTENEGLGLASEDSRFVALGIELNALDWAQLRFGYRADTVNSDRNVTSAGIGISPFGIHIDLGVAGNQDEIGGSFQLGFRF